MQRGESMTSLSPEVEKLVDECAKRGGILKVDLKLLAKLFLYLLFSGVRKKQVSIKENVEIPTRDGRKVKFDYVVYDHTDGEIVGVVVKSWKRVIGANVVTQFSMQLREARMKTGILIGTEFSVSAVRMAERLGIALFSRGEIVSFLATQYPDILSRLEPRRA